jgi:hypothetical protein
MLAQPLVAPLAPELQLLLPLLQLQHLLLIRMHL